MLFPVTSNAQEIINQVVVIGDSHLWRINKNELKHNVEVAAPGGMNARGVNIDYIQKFKNKNVAFLLVGGNDIHYHPR